MRPRWMVAVAGGVVFLAAQVSPTLAAPVAPAKIKKLSVTSPAFGNNQPIPSGFTCEGENASPPLKLGKAPKGTKDRALIMTDPDAPSGTLTHWVAWNLPNGGVPEQTLPPAMVQGKNTFGNAAYAGPCPPAGSAPHHYVFTVSAVSKKIKLAPGASADELRAAIKGNVLAQGTLTGTYQRGTGTQ
ncbi:MAG TPA: YbhB/YbcL family Raf kinase inhibitor-like protein [Acidimicrobiia bacterium]|nr:YbhB/YbcL family Raf kinase inhibitor-like protein [Acidimicrobiia bacterium]